MRVGVTCVRQVLFPAFFFARPALHLPEIKSETETEAEKQRAQSSALSLSSKKDVLKVISMFTLHTCAAIDCTHEVPQDPQGGAAWFRGGMSSLRY